MHCDVLAQLTPSSGDPPSIRTGVGVPGFADAQSLYASGLVDAVILATPPSTHVPLAKTVPGLKSYQISAGPVAAGQGESPYHLVAILEFESMDALQAGLGSPEGQATAGDLANFYRSGDFKKYAKAVGTFFAYASTCTSS